MSKGGSTGSARPSYQPQGGGLNANQPPQAQGNGWGQMPGAYQPQQQPRAYGGVSSIGSALGSLRNMMMPQQPPGMGSPIHQALGQFMQQQPQPMQQPQPGGHVVGAWGLAHPDIIAQRQAARQSQQMQPNYQNMLGALGQNYNGRPMNVSGGLMGMF